MVYVSILNYHIFYLYKNSIITTIGKGFPSTQGGLIVLQEDERSVARKAK